MIWLAYPSSLGMRRAMKSSRGVFPKVLRNGQSKEEGNASNEEVSHGIHVCELQE